MRKLYRSLLATGVVFGLAACGDDVTVTPPAVDPPATVTSVTVAGPATLRIGESAIFSAGVVTNGTGVNTAVTWASANSAIASVNATGTVTGVTAGSTTIRATSVANPGAIGAANVTVVPNVVRSVVVTPGNATIAVAATLPLTAFVDRDPGVVGTVTWATSAAAIASVSTNGVVTGVAVGTAVITATSTADVNKSGSMTIVITPQPNALNSLTLTPTSINLGPGGTQQITTITQAAAGATITWANTSNNVAVATVTAANANPTITAVGNGTAVITIQATATAAGFATNSIPATVTVNVQAASVSISNVTACFVGPGFPPPPCVVGPVDILNVFGQIEVTLNINPGFQTLDSVRVKLGGTVAAGQGFTVSGAPTAPITLSMNTAVYTISAAAGTASVRHPNGSTVIQSELFPRGATSPTASNTIDIFLNNSDTFHGIFTLPTGVNQAVAATGLVWHGGPSAVWTLSALPVSYSGNAIATATLALQDWVTPNPGPFPSPFPPAPAVVPFAPGVPVCTGPFAVLALPFTVAWGAGAIPAPPAAVPATCVGVTNAFVTPGVVASLYANGNPGPVATTVVPPPPGFVNFGNRSCVNPGGAPCNLTMVQPGAAFNGMQLSTRVDVAGPTGVVLAGAGNPNNWANAGTSFSAGVISATNAFSTARGTDAVGPFGAFSGGVGLCAVSAAGACAAPAAASDVYTYFDIPSVTMVAFTPNAHLIPEDPIDFSNRAYGARLAVRDLLLNATTTGLSGTIRADGGLAACTIAAPTGTTVLTSVCAFGVDVTAPTAEYAGGLFGAPPPVGPPVPLLANMTTAVSPASDSILHTVTLNTQGLTSSAGVTAARFGARYRDTRSGFHVATDPGPPPGGIFQRVTRVGNPATFVATVALGSVVAAPAVPTCGSGFAVPFAGYANFYGVVGLDDLTYRRDSVLVTGAAPGALPAAAGLAVTTPGVYTYTTCARDRANNVSVPLVTKRAAVDVSAPLITGLGVPAILTGGTFIAFTPTGLDDQEINQGGLYLTYPNMATGSPSGLANRVYYPPFTAGATNQGPGTTNFWYEDPSALAGAWNNTICSPVGPSATCGAPPRLTGPLGFLLGIDLAVGGIPPVAVTLTYRPDSVGAILFDIKRLEATLAGTTPDSSVFGVDPVLTVPLLPGLIAAGTPFPAIGVGTWSIFGPSTGGAVAVARAMTSTSVTNPPFPQVAFFRLDCTTPAGKGRWVHIGTITAAAPLNPTIFDSGTNRFWDYSLGAITPALAGGGGAGCGVGDGNVIRAIGMSVTGNGLSTASLVIP